MRPPAVRATVAITLGIAAGVSLTCEPHVSVGDNKNDKSLAIGFIPKSYGNPLFKLAYIGALQAATDLKQQSDWTVRITLYDPTTLDAQPAVVERAAQFGIPGMLVSCASNDVSKAIFDAVNLGTSVITFDSDCPDSGRLDFYGTSNIAAGKQAADLLVQAMNGATDQKQVAILSGNQGADNLNARIQGFKDRLSEKYTSVTVATISYCDEKPQPCKDNLESIIGQYPELDGLFVVGLWGVEAACDCDFPAYCGCEDSQIYSRMPKWYTATKGKLKTVAFDAHPFELELMKQGFLSALIGQRYYEWGYCTVGPMFRHLREGEGVAFPRADGYYVVHPDDVDTVISRWNALYAMGTDASTAAQPPDCVDGGL